MSGGSYDYLFTKDTSELLDLHGAMLPQMSERLAGLGYAADAARETEDLLLTVRQMTNRLEARLERMREVWRAVEWWDSGDSGESGLTVALARYRGEALPRCEECGDEIVTDDHFAYRKTGFRHVGRSDGCTSHQPKGANE